MNETTTVATLSSGAMCALHLIAPNKADRPYLNGALLDFQHRCAVATDGSIMLIAKMEVPPECSSIAPAIIPKALLKGASAVKDSPAFAVALSDPGAANGRSIRVYYIGGTLTGTEVDGRFPDYRHAVPRSVNGQAGFYDPRLLATLSQALALAGGYDQKKTPAVLYQNGPNTTAVMVNTSLDGLGIIRTIRERADDLPKRLAAFGIEP